MIESDVTMTGNVRTMQDVELIRSAVRLYRKTSLMGCAEEVHSRAETLRREILRRLEVRRETLVEALNTKLTQRTVLDREIQELEESLDYYPSL